ncbi:MAG: LPS export ABC transporter ATP-binding protein [Planctomycetota bacterium]|nr:MAG: LPS export ABC transporter ATP-binding protein [Planctomycetota bacterium]
MSASVLEVKNLVKRFGGRPAVDRVAFSVREGGIFGLLGPNGAGKTTTFKMIMGLVRPDAGEILLDGRSIGGLPMYRRARLGLGYLAQEPAVIESFSVEENITALLEARGVSRSEAAALADELLEEFNIAYLKGRKAARLSGGERRRLEIARTLSLKPRILLLDEPFSGIDPKSVEEIKGFITALRDKGIGVLLTDHNVRDTFSITDEACIIEKGAVIARGSPSELIENRKVRNTYLGDAFTM